MLDTSAQNVATGSDISENGHMRPLVIFFNFLTALIGAVVVVATTIYFWLQVGQIRRSWRKFKNHSGE
jgi:hypothetical protein